MLSMAAVFSNCPKMGPPLATTHVCNVPLLKLSRSFNGGNLAFPCKRAFFSATHLSKASSFCIRSFQPEDAGVDDAASTIDLSKEGVRVNKELLSNQQDSGKSNSFLVILAIGLGVAATVTILSIILKLQNLGSSLGIEIQRLADISSSSSLATPSVGFSFNAFGYRVVLPQYAPGWIYFWLLMAAGCGIFISEEALNIWVGITLARKLRLDGTWQSFATSFSNNAPYIISTVLWVYWGVCISDMIPFYVGKFSRQYGVVQRYCNISGFVERFSLGVRNPTAFLAGAMGVSPEYFFVAVCCGGLITLPIQLAIGFLFREQPLLLFALATVATVVVSPALQIRMAIQLLLL